ncbi:MAG TPA: hypothetical protein VH268_13600 [Solirubrobacterales bacterium]|nr:hypothetical protein [Solirubrobacterales bacterium]
MSKKFNGPGDNELRHLEQRLSDAKPALSALELDAAKLRIMQSAPRREPGLLTRKKGNFMKSRVALIAVLALGVFMSGTGATLAVSGFANTGSASSTQYAPPTKHNHHHVVEAAAGEGGTQEAAPAVETQAVQQVAATSESGSSLPFTGFLAVPVLIVGLGLLGAGVAMRMRVRRSNDIS